MIESWLFIFAILAVLLIPGPSNAFLANAAHQQGVLKSLKLIPIEILGYVYGISLWALIIHLSMPTWPMLIHLLHFVSAVYVVWLAFHLWKSAHLEKHRQTYPNLKPRQLFFSVFKNPKTILFTAGIFPAETWNSFESYFSVFAVFILCLIPAALFWIYFGQALLAGKLRGINADHLYKGSAMLLMLCMLPVVAEFF